MKKLVLSTAGFPTDLDERARFSRWREAYCDWVGPSDMDCLRSTPFAGRWEFAQAKDMRLARFRGTAHSIGRTAQQVAASPHEHYFLCLNVAPAALSFRQSRRESAVAGTQASLFSGTDAFRCDGANDWMSVGIAQDVLRRLVPRVDDLTATAFDATAPAMRHLRRYLAMLMEPDSLADDSALLDHVETTMLDLVALALGTADDAAALARARGLRAARGAEVLAEIARGYADPGFSTRQVAARLGISPSYIQKLMLESGQSFTERVLEQRLQAARRMIADRRHDRRKIGDIALACGFNEISYFNRCFRRRFGDTPSAWRGKGD